MKQESGGLVVVVGGRDWNMGERKGERKREGTIKRKKGREKKRERG